MPNKTVRGSQTTQPRAGKACGRSALRIEGRRFRRTALCVVAFALWLGLASNASANHHKITLLDANVCSADASVQHVRVRMDDFDENFWANCVDFQFYDANSTQVDSFLSPHDLTSGENVIVDIGTAAYAASSGTTLDMVLPADNMMISNGQVCIRNSGLEHPPPEDFSCKDMDQCVNVSVVSCSVASVCGDGVLDAGEQCDDGGTAAGDCCSATCQIEPATTTCRAAAGTCDLAETCDGTTVTCPSDEKNTDVCRSAAGDCDVAESCDGVTDTCPADGVASATTSCRAAAGECDLAETCDGTTTTCPSDEKNTDVCRSAAGDCDVAESCDGVTDTCPSDQFDPALCDDDVYCNGDETCNAGLCETGSPPLCTGSTPLCDEAVRNCSACLVDNDCSNGAFCDGTEVCNAGVCDPGAAPTCESPTPLCDDTLAGCVECQTDFDCTEGERCEAQVCLELITTPINVPSASPTVLFVTVFMFCATAFALMARR
jgi:cysteine-rich repeat protein